MSVDLSKVKLGKKAPKIDPRTLKLEKILPVLPVPPASIDWSGGITEWGMMGNDKYGDCTIACVAHEIMAWSKNATGFADVVPDNVIINIYEVVTNNEGGKFDPSTGANDNGCIILDVLNTFRHHGVGKHKIEGYAQVNQNNINEVKNAINIFGGINCGFQLPSSINGQEIWDIVPGSPIEGGHCVPIVAYDNEYLTCVTWGGLQKMTYRFFAEFCDEAYALISGIWVGNNKTPEGLNLLALQQYLNELDK